MKLLSLFFPVQAALFLLNILVGVVLQANELMDMYDLYREEQAWDAYVQRHMEGGV